LPIIGNQFFSLLKGKDGNLGLFSALDFIENGIGALVFFFSFSGDLYYSGPNFEQLGLNPKVTQSGTA